MTKLNEHIFYVAKDALMGEGLQTAIPNLEFIVEIPGCDSAISILQKPEIQERLPAGSNILVFKPAPKIEFLAKERGWNIIAPSAELNRRFENKIQILEDFAAVKMPVIDYLVVEPKNTSWSKLGDKFGSKLVAQTERGHAGSSSVVLEGEIDFQKLEPELPTKFMAFIKGETWTVNACATKYGTLVSRPFFQLQGKEVTGIEDPLGTCGNLHKEVSDELTAEIVEHTKRFGDYVYKEGYRGWFGMDVLIQDGKVAGFIECNPRLTGSAGVFTEMQVEAGQTPLIVLHVLEILEKDYELDLDTEQEKLLQGFRESHIFIYNPKELGKDHVIDQKPGIYTPEGEFKREGSAWADLKKGEVLFRLRKHGSVIPPGKSYGGLITRGEIPNVSAFRA